MNSTSPDNESSSTNAAKTIFAKAQEIAESAMRAAYVAEACGDDEALQAEVERLLAAADEAGDFMLGPAVDTMHSTSPWAGFRRDEAAGDGPVVEGPGTVIGPYKLMEQIGEGGFGLVFVAQQHRPVRRKVALKIIKPGMDTRDVIARFEAERQALALMDHPNIAKVFDAGTTGPASGCPGRPYFVMELVRGIPITEFCDQRHLTPRERLELFISVCKAIQHAHQKGIIHRDVKPTNVLVTLHDGVPVVKVIDFGVAKALSQQLTERTIYTQFAQMIGTPLYMSPEQAEMSGLDIDTRSDIYSLGVLLYELLTGTTPFDRERLSKAAADEIRRIIREEDPPKPSTRISQSHDRLPSIAALRNTEPAKLSKLVRGDLDWIVMKCLEKDRNRRYETANGLAQDIARFLHDEPVVARPPSGVYRFQKLVRRNKAAFAAAGAVLLAMVLGTVISTWQAIRATSATRAERAAHIAAKKSEEAAIQSASKARREFTRADDYFLRTRAIVDRMAERLQEPSLLQIPAVVEIRKLLLRDLLSFYQRFAEHDGVDAKAVEERTRAMRMVGDIHAMLGERERAEKAYTEAIAVLEYHVAQYPAELDPQQYLATCHAHLGNLMQETDRLVEAQQRYRRALELWARLAVERPINPTYAQSLEKFHKRLFDLLDESGQSEAAQDLCWQLLAPFEKRAADSPHRLDLQIQLGDAVLWAGELLKDTSRPKKAEKARDRALELYAKLPEVVPDSPGSGNIARRYLNKASLLVERNRFQEAEIAYRQAIAIHSNAAFRATAQFQLGDLLSRQPERHADARQAYLHALDYYEKQLDRSPANPGLYNTIAWFLANCSISELRDFDRAAELASRAVKLAPSDGSIWNTLGVAQYRAGNYALAIEALNKSIELRHGGDSFDWFVLAMAEWRTGNQDTAYNWYDKAVEWMQRNSPADEELIRFRDEAAELLGTQENDITSISSDE